MHDRPSETEEWMADRIDSWVETYKKSMLTPVILTLVARHQPTSIATVTELLGANTGWHVTERGLYRTVKRLVDSGLLHSVEVDAPRTGVKRKELTLSALGAQFLEGVSANVIDLDSRP